LQARQARVGEAPAPQGDGVVLAAQFLGDLPVGGAAFVGGAEDDAGAADEGLGCGVGAGQALQLVALLVGEGDGKGMRGWHGRSLAKVS
jgi:hypothetical protein